ncbi:putative V-type proton ATPase subunit H 1 [Astathelohania contejeani]|uniref:V-type proton ATPase subunit H 1 n=1 Tax=Astathelohania contejeani TaxID=164912 RepID=A0ABQ7I0Q7_9MICR|nr:putative V-type proton ATPase subunit H 1 [Thelohania contejeani]
MLIEEIEKSEEFIKEISENPDSTQAMLYNTPSFFNNTQLLSLLSSPETYISLKALAILTIRYADSEPDPVYWMHFRNRIKRETGYKEIDQLFWFLGRVLTNGRNSLRLVKPDSGATLLTPDGFFDRDLLKEQFCKDETLMTDVFDFLNVGILQYNILKIIWILSFNARCIKLMENFQLMEKICEVIGETHKEKILRISVSILRHGIEAGSRLTLTSSYRLVNTLGEILHRSPGDEDFVADMQFCRAQLSEALKRSSSVDYYLSELFTGQLESASYHFNDKFWEGNQGILLENKKEIIKALKRYLRSQNVTWLCVSANDIYRLIKTSPKIMDEIKRYGVKDDLFNLTESPNDDVRFHAVQALSACIFSEWI